MVGHPTTQKDVGEALPVARSPTTTVIDDPAVTLVSDMRTSFMAMLYGAVFGTASAFLILALFVTWMGGDAPTWVVSGVFVIAWLVSTWLISFQTDQLLTVFRRACAVGAMEWLLLSLSGVGAPPVMAQTNTSVAGTVAREAGIATSLSGGVATVMFWLCAFAFVFCWLVSRPKHAD